MEEGTLPGILRNVGAGICSSFYHVFSWNDTFGHGPGGNLALTRRLVSIVLTGRLHYRGAVSCGSGETFEQNLKWASDITKSMLSCLLDMPLDQGPFEVGGSDGCVWESIFGNESQF